MNSSDLINPDELKPGDVLIIRNTIPLFEPLSDGGKPNEHFVLEDTDDDGLSFLDVVNMERLFIPKNQFKSALEMFSNNSAVLIDRYNLKYKRGDLLVGTGPNGEESLQVDDFFRSRLGFEGYVMTANTGAQRLYFGELIDNNTYLKVAKEGE